VITPWTTRGQTTQAQVSALYVTNPKFFYDELNIVGEAAYLQVDDVTPVSNQDGVCMSGTDCNDFSDKGDTLFYDKRAWAAQLLLLPKKRNIVSGWDLGTPLTLAWLIHGNPASPGAFGALYGDGDKRASLGATAQYAQNLQFSLQYNAFFGDADKLIGRSTLHANPFVDHDYVTFDVKYSY
jgi:hypothetical protein